MNEQKKPELIFMPGCFDNFEGTQEELDEMIAEIQRLVDTGEIFEQAKKIDIDEFIDEFSDEELEEIQSTAKRTLQ